MSLPRLPRNTQHRVTVPALDGGVNYRDAAHLVADNQLTDGCNLWWKDRALRARPGLQTDADHVTAIGKREVYNTETNGHTERVAYYTNGDIYLDGTPAATVLDTKRERESGGAPYEEEFDLWAYTDEGEVVSLGGIRDLYDGENIHLCVRHGADWYAYGYGANATKVFRRTGEAARFSAVEPYVPIVAVNAHGTEAESLDDPAYFDGILYQERNALTGAFRTRFSPNGSETVFPLPEQGLASGMGRTIEVRLTRDDGTVTVFHIAYNTNLSDETAQVGGSQAVHAAVDRTRGLIYFTPDGSALVAPAATRLDGLEVTAWRSRSGFQVEHMRFATWFGGAEPGLGGGSRLFLSGDAQEPTLVCWSAADNPLYFPESNCVRVGDADQAVTAFGRQEDMLVLFKEHQLYYTVYETGDGADDAAFPVTQINPAVGCDCPHTVQLCDNRLVWATAEGRVYALVAANPYSENNVRELSGRIGPALRLAGRDALRAATAGDYAGHYVLQAGGQLFLLDYSGGFSDGMPWFVWDVSMPGVAFRRFFANGDRAILLAEKETADNCYRLVYTLAGTTDLLVDLTDGVQLVERPVYTAFQTRLFDFGAPERRKFIRRVYLGASDTARGYLSLSYVTENGLCRDAARLGDGGNRLREWAVFPGVSRVRRFALRVQGDGAMAIDGIVLVYENSGEVR